MALSYLVINDFVDIPEICFPVFLLVWRRSVHDPSPEHSTGETWEISYGFEMLPSVRVFLETLWVA